jgi:DNA-binding transcriptional MocR family regulator
MNTSDLRSFLDRVRERYTAFRNQGHQLNLGRGKPSPPQLDLANALLSLDAAGYRAEDNTDCRNYGGLQGLREARALFSCLVGAPPAQIVAADNSSLALMHDTLTWAVLHGVVGGSANWSTGGPATFLCPVPGYDRHFSICDGLGVRMVTVPLTGYGPDMEEVERLVVRDSSVKGMWCVPKYSNPTGEIYSDEVVERLAAMPTAAPDFRLFWDNAYSVHHLTDSRHEIANVLELCQRHGHADRAFVFASTSKMTFAGAGVALFASSPANVAWLLGHMERRTIGPNKLEQLRHVRLFRNREGIAAHMEAHARILAPKFKRVHDTFSELLADTGIASWTRPEGGYFVSLDVLDGCARRVVELAKNAGVVVVPAGSTYPGGTDPSDRNIRIAPSFPTLDDVARAAEGMSLAVLLAGSEAILTQRGESTPVADAVAP